MKLQTDAVTITKSPGPSNQSYGAAVSQYAGMALIAVAFALPWTAIYGEWITGWELLRAGLLGVVPWYLGLWPAGVGMAALAAFATSRMRFRHFEVLGVMALSAATALELGFLTVVSAQCYGGSDRVIWGGAIVGVGLVCMWATAARALIGRFR